MYECMFFYTGKGDKGKSHIGKKKIPKDSVIFEALGDLDELNSLVGVVKSGLRNKPLQKKLQNTQESLFIIQARVAWILFPQFKAKQLSKKKIAELEKEIDAIEKKIQPDRGFVIAGSEQVSAHLDYLRAVSRRVERSLNKLHKKDTLPPEVLTYANRLSSYYYALARDEVYRKKVKEPQPTYE